MPRRQFIKDLEAVCTNLCPPGIANIAPGEDDGQIEFWFNNVEGSVKITALITDLADYPSSHEYMLFVDDDAPREISTAVQGVRGINRKPVHDMLEVVAGALNNQALDHDGDSHMPDSQFDDDAYTDDSDDDVYDFEREAYGSTAMPTLSTATPSTSITHQHAGLTMSVRNRTRSDLRTAKDAGFKIAALGHLMDGHNCFIVVSVRMAKLGISKEAMQAWQVEPNEYLMLLIHYPHGYKTNEQVQSFDHHQLSTSLSMRVVAGKTYKPTLQEAIQTFATTKNDASNKMRSAGEASTSEPSTRNIFISKPLSNLLNERLATLLRYRSAGMPWSGAEELYSEQSVASANIDLSIIPDANFQPESLNSALPAIVNADHYTSRNISQHSFPLLAMQYTLRHFVRCTEFCLVCHRKLDTDVQAIKPYVCDNSLCLFQYMTLGFGPSIEHELLAQPYVVDLLVSFCYNSAHARKLKDFPDGLSIQVPPIDDVYVETLPTVTPHSWMPTSSARRPLTKDVGPKAPVYPVGYNAENQELLFQQYDQPCPVRAGSWIVLKLAEDEDTELHCRVKEVTFFPSIRLDELIVMKMPKPEPQLHTPPRAPPKKTVKPVVNSVPQLPVNEALNIGPAFGSMWKTASFQKYELDFQELSDTLKCVSICRLLDSLPTVLAMQNFLSQNPASELKDWSSRISTSALVLLRWIIASNRSCIMQVDGSAQLTVQPGELAETQVQSRMVKRSQERLFGMKDFVQFRFAMGAPDKEQRFVTEVRNTTTRLKLEYPTIFAFHGSPVYNWHMIIREGLHYKNADHGRAYGDGVYHARDANTSRGYTHARFSNAPGNGDWNSSVLKVQSAMALNELVNAPAEFQSRNPFYVVQQLDWIQTRYLFVQCMLDSKDSGHTIRPGEEIRPVAIHRQDPAATPTGVSGQIIIPAAAVRSGELYGAVSRDIDDENSSHQGKKIKRDHAATLWGPPPAYDHDSDAMSVSTDDGDLDILFDEALESQPEALVALPPSKAPMTDFVPGTVNYSTLPIMPLPTYANSATTKRLLKELGSLSKMLQTTAAAELGWYIDTAKIENVYQWIVELHSFHTFTINGEQPLPLATDMQKRKIKSIVLEVRYNKDFPFSPPYVRVIRPRFLMMQQGGGGHIVGGGAMCMELLTNTGWSSVSSMESVLMQIRMAIASEPYARLSSHESGDYGVAEAAEGYMRTCARHGWQVPPGFKEMAYGMPKM